MNNEDLNNERIRICAENKILKEIINGILGCELE